MVLLLHVYGTTLFLSFGGQILATSKSILCRAILTPDCGIDIYCAIRVKKERMMKNKILVVEREGNICTLILNRPEKKNSLSPDMLIKIFETMNELSKDDTIRTVIFRDAGDSAFSSGYDIRSLPTNLTPEIQEKLKTQNLLELVSHGECCELPLSSYSNAEWIRLWRGLRTGNML